MPPNKRINSDGYSCGMRNDLAKARRRILKVQSQEKTVFPFDFYLLLFDFTSKTPCNLYFSFF